MSETVTGALLAAAIASLGYVARLLLQEWREWRDRRAARLSSLLALQALLKASRTAFLVQNDLARRLTDQLSDTGEPDDSAGFDALFVARFDTFTPEEADDHRVIRGYTEHALRPINERTSTWLRDDIEYRCYVSPRGHGHNSAKETTDPRARLAESLSALDSHLLLWHAKYAVWLPDRPTHALVYLDDEKKQGLGFPKRVEADVQAVIDAESRRRFNLGGRAEPAATQAGASAQG